jgi:putative endopeptidase
MKKIMMTIGIAALALTGCNQVKETAKPAIDLANFDNSTAPGEDFYQYACGGWMEANPLTAEYARYGIFDQLDKENQEKLKTLIDDLNAKPQAAGSVGAKIQTMYAMGMDMEKRNADGAAPVAQQLEQIKAISSMDELSAVTAKMHIETSSPFFGFYIGADEKNSTMNLLQIYQGGISMGDRDYYLLDDEASVKMRNAYKNYINTLFTLAGYSGEVAFEKEALDAYNLRLEKLKQDGVNFILGEHW